VALAQPAGRHLQRLRADRTILRRGRP
jgi:hypothetical protein